MIDIIGLGSGLLVAKPLVVMPRLAVVYGSDPEPKGKPRRKNRRMPGREPDARFRSRQPQGRPTISRCEPRGLTSLTGKQWWQSGRNDPRNLPLAAEISRGRAPFCQRLLRMISSAQLRAARGLLGWTPRALAKKAGCQSLGSPMRSIVSPAANDDAAGYHSNDTGKPGHRISEP